MTSTEIRHADVKSMIKNRITAFKKIPQWIVGDPKSTRVIGNAADELAVLCVEFAELEKHVNRLEEVPETGSNGPQKDVDAPAQA